MKFCWVTLMVKNMDISVKFYNEIVGLKLNRRFTVKPGYEISFMGDGETEIELICDDSKEAISIGQDISLGFEVKSLDEIMAYVKEKGIAIHSGPIQPNPHVKFFYVLDPNGVKIQFVENL